MSSWVNTSSLLTARVFYRFLRLVCCWAPFGHCTAASCAQHGALRARRAPSLCRQGSSKPKPSRDARVCISFMCNFSSRLVNLKQQPYKSCSFVWAGDQVLLRNILEGEKKNRGGTEELGQLCASDGRYLILRFCKNNIPAIAFMRGIYRTILQPTCV